MRYCSFVKGDDVRHVGKPEFRGRVVATIAKVTTDVEPIYQVYVQLGPSCEDWAWEHLLELDHPQAATTEADRIAAAIRAFSH